MFSLVTEGRGNGKKIIRDHRGLVGWLFQYTFSIYNVLRLWKESINNKHYKMIVNTALAEKFSDDIGRVFFYCEHFLLSFRQIHLHLM